MRNQDENEQLPMNKLRCGENWRLRKWIKERRVYALKKSENEYVSTLSYQLVQSNDRVEGFICPVKDRTTLVIFYLQSLFYHQYIIASLDNLDPIVNHWILYVYWIWTLHILSIRLSNCFLKEKKQIIDTYISCLIKCNAREKHLS